MFDWNITESLIGKNMIVFHSFFLIWNAKDKKISLNKLENIVVFCMWLMSSVLGALVLPL